MGNHPRHTGAIVAKGDRYVEISLAQMDGVLVEKCGFTRLDPKDRPRSREFIYSRRVTRNTDTGSLEYPMVVEVNSSVHVSDGKTRSVGEDAIRVLLLRDTPDGLRPVPKKWHPRANITVFRTKSALDTLYKACREQFSLAYRMACPECNHVLAPREGRNGRFYGCTRYPECRGTRQASEVELST